MFGIGSGELFLIIVVAVLVLGPEHLPRIMRTTQTVMSTFRKITTEFQRTLNLEEVLKETDSRPTTKRQPSTTKKKKKTSGSPTTTKKKTSKKTSPESASKGQAPEQESAQASPAEQKTPKSPTSATSSTADPTSARETSTDTADATRATTSATAAPAGPANPADRESPAQAHSNTAGPTATGTADNSVEPTQSANIQEAKTANGTDLRQTSPDVSPNTDAHPDADNASSHEETTYPRPTEYIKVTPQTQPGYGDDEPEPSADGASPQAGTESAGRASNKDISSSSPQPKSTIEGEDAS